MSYVEQDDPDIVEDNMLRKEFYWTKSIPKKKKGFIEDVIPRFLLDDLISRGMFLTLHSYQLFIKNFMTPNTPYKRLLVKWETGTGKTIGVLSIAMNFIDFYKRESESGGTEIGTVFIIGFSENVFKNELLRYVEFRFIKKEEKIRLAKLRKLAQSGSRQDLEKYRDLATKIKKRFNNRKGNGFFRFFGYKAFVNRIFITTPGKNITLMSEEEIRASLQDGTIKYNTDLLDQFKNSLLICDEIHNVYNSLEKNNWGIAIQSVLDAQSSCRAVFMSATPLNNSPTEIVDLLNLLLPKENRVQRSDFFTTEKELKPDALDKIGKLSRGRISFLRDLNPKFYPEIHAIGEELKAIPLLRFIRSPMSSFHYNTYKVVYSGALAQDSQYLVDFALPNPDPNSDIGMYQTQRIKRGLINAPQKWKEKMGIDFRDGKIVGSFLKWETLEKYSTKYAKLLEEIDRMLRLGRGKIFIYHNIVHMSGVLFIEQMLLNNGYLDEFSNSIANTKCAICGLIKKDHKSDQIEVSGGDDLIVDYVNCYVKEGDCPIIRFRYVEDDIFIESGWLDMYHKNIKKALNLLRGQSVICEVNPGGWSHRALQQLDFEEFDPQGVDKSRVSSTGQRYIYMKSPVVGEGENIRKRKSSRKLIKKRTEERGKLAHKFRPVRFIMANSEIEKRKMDHSIEKYNSSDNADGSRYMILVGSKIIKESYDIKAVQNVIIVGRPDNIPTLIQIRGRAVRKCSHQDLPPEDRNVWVKILTSCLPVKQTSGPDKGKWQMSYEEEKYMEKVILYKVIQQIENTFHENAIDSVVNRNIIWNKRDIEAKRRGELEEQLTAVWFEPKVSKRILDREFRLSELNLSTFDVFYVKQEVDIIIRILKRLFLEVSPIWTYDDLWRSVKEPYVTHPDGGLIHYEQEINTSLLSEDNYIIALNSLVWVKKSEYVEPMLEKIDTIEGLVDRLMDVNDKLIMLPGGQDSVVVQVDKFYILLPLDPVSNEPIVDMELPYRVVQQPPPKSININNFVETKKVEFDYDDKKRLFIRKWKDVSIEFMENAVCEYGASFHIRFVEECIEYVFQVWIKPNITKSEHHDFYFKMLYYYDLLSLVLWVYTAKPRIAKDYSKYAIPYKVKNIKIKDDINPSDKSELSTSGVINLLKTSISRSSAVWAPKELREQYNRYLQRSLELFSGKKKKAMAQKITKVSAELLPIGHFISIHPRIYHPESGWTDSPEYNQAEEEYIENNTVIGYDEKSKTGVLVRFKIRNPMQNIKKYKDTRLIEKGSVCKSKNKAYLRLLSKKLKIELPEYINVESLCTLIRSRLIRLELRERINKTKVKWFYHHYEPRPETTK